MAALLFFFLNVLCLFAAHSSADRLPLLLLVCTILLVMVSTELVLLIHLQFFCSPPNARHQHFAWFDAQRYFANSADITLLFIAHGACSAVLYDMPPVTD
eukprot:scpid25566/ scgid30487/ 